MNQRTHAAEARIHRHGDSVAFHIDETPTLYLSDAGARRLAAQLLQFADDVECRKFTESQLAAVSFDLEPSGGTHR